MTHVEKIEKNWSFLFYFIRKTNSIHIKKFDLPDQKLTLRTRKQALVPNKLL